jgi:hypothetical protein
MSTWEDAEILRMLLASVPADASAPERRQQDIKTWLELTRQHVDWEKRGAVWEMLVSWQHEGIMERSSRGRLPELPLLAPALARALEWEQNGDVLLSMAGWAPEQVEVAAHPKAVRAVVARWEDLSRNGNWRIRREAWVGRWNLMRAGVLTAEEQSRFTADYMDAVRAEKGGSVWLLLALAQMQPSGSFRCGTGVAAWPTGTPGTVWRHTWRFTTGWWT